MNTRGKSVYGKDADGCEELWSPGDKAIVYTPECEQTHGMIVTVREGMVQHCVLAPYGQDFKYPAVSLLELSWLPTEKLRKITLVDLAK